VSLLRIIARSGVRLGHRGRLGLLVVHKDVHGETIVLRDQRPSDSKATTWPSALGEAFKLPSSKPVSVPSAVTLARTVVWVCRSRTKTSRSMLPSPVARLPSLGRSRGARPRSGFDAYLHRGQPALRGSTSVRMATTAALPDFRVVRDGWPEVVPHATAWLTPSIRATAHRCPSRLLAANSPEDHQVGATWEDTMSRVERNQGAGRDPARRAAAHHTEPSTLVQSPRRMRFADRRVTLVVGKPFDPLNLSARAPGWQG
jgi:hypothetical protein